MQSVISCVMSRLIKSQESRVKSLETPVPHRLRQPAHKKNHCVSQITLIDIISVLACVAQEQVKAYGVQAALTGPA